MHQGAVKYLLFILTGNASRMPVMTTADAEKETAPAIGVKSDVFLKTPPRQGSLIEFRNPQDPEKLPYYHGTLDKDETESRLSNRGDFLIRKDPSDESLVLAVRSTQDHGVIHLALKENLEGRFTLPPLETKTSDGNAFRSQHVDSVEEFVCFFYLYKFPLMDSFLLNPVSKP